jgi:hypothetical protein
MAADRREGSSGLEFAMRRLSLVSLAVSAAALAAASPAAAAEFFFTSQLTPEVAGATGTGSVAVTFDDVAHTLAISALWSGLSGTTTVSHIHCCVAPPGTVGVAVTPGTLPGFPVGVTSGSYGTVLDLTSSATYTAAFLNGPGGGTAAGAAAALLAGLQGGNAYFNVHTTAFPGGEIRGFLGEVPEPATWALLLLGFMGIGYAMRTRASGRTTLAYG